MTHATPSRATRPSRRPGSRIGPLAALLATVGSTLALAGDPPGDPDASTTRYGGYLPPGGFAPDGGNPWGGYTPFGRDGGWAKLSYGWRYNDFGPSYRFGHNDPSYLEIYAIRPPVRGLGRWDRQGRADDE